MTVPLPEGTDRASRELARILLDTGAMQPDWAPAFAAVPRSDFVPDLAWAWDEEQGRSIAVDRATDPEGWLAAVHADIPLVTQWDDGHHTGPEPGRLSTSSTSQPTLVMSMLRDLDVRPGLKVLEAGTGTGWNAGLLAQRLGSRQVVSIEVDPTIAPRARTNLGRVGLTPQIIAGDGELGWPAGAPYDRIIATYGLRHIPHAWLQQTRPGGIILAPWGTHYSQRDAVVKLTVADDQHSASGHFTELVGFMKARDQRTPYPEHSTRVPEFPGNADATQHTTRTAGDLGGPWDVQPFVIGLAVPDATHILTHDDANTSTTAWVYSLTDSSWAAATWPVGRPQTRSTVYQSGPRQLWQAVEHTLDWWDQHDRPAIHRFGLTISDDRHTPWLDTPGHPVPQQL
ncbi:methyltransferase domain-containing protein [Kitasatospora kifunensis]|uniref:Protein-L-isoaspartate O-methyltransferase n=1 Tax=Kitasatospora kifunensis TaxID=58351 RepID=A0A7W7VWW8_KITKI|nr:methyltransferase domain-containing protein [Kitasatospora kifunensis]MBB4925876.1 protein-L-isoaspartate O-methyltransferase [Kitasatospora kifunensis]